MWGITKKRSDPVPATIEERLRKVESELVSVRADWEVVLDKVFHWMKRTGARKRSEEEQGAGEVVPSPQPTDPVSARIWKRRRHSPPTVEQ